MKHSIALIFDHVSNRVLERSFNYVLVSILVDSFLSS